MDSWGYPVQCTGASGATGDEFSRSRLLPAKGCPPLGQLRLQAAHSPAFTAADCELFMVLQFHQGVAHVDEKSADRCLQGKIIPQGARIMDAYLAVGIARQGLAQPLGMKNFVDGLNGKALPVLAEDFGAVGTGREHGLNAMPGEQGEHLAKNRVKISGSAQIMGRFGAAIQHHAE